MAPPKHLRCPRPQINKEALRAQTNSTGYTTFERLIPVEAMFIVSFETI